MLTTERHLKPIAIFINAKIILPGSIENDNEESISLNINQTLNEQLKSFLLKKSIKLNKQYYCYLLKGKDILKSLPKNSLVKNLNLHHNDIILISYEKKQIKSQLKSTDSNELPSEENISYKEQITEKLDKQTPIIHITKKSEINNDNQKNVKKKIKILIIIFSILLVLASLVYLFIYLMKRKRPEPKTIYNRDKLVVEKKYPVNMILRYSNKKETEMKLEGDKVPKKDSSQSLWMTSDFIF